MKGTRKNRICVEKICFYCDEIAKILENHGRSKEYFFNSVEMQYACSMCIVQIGEMISLLEDEFIGSHPEIPWRQIKGARNIYVHGYGELDLDEVWNTLTENVPVLKNQISEILAKFEEKQ